MYQTEHNELFASIRNGTPINNGDYMTKSTLMAIMGTDVGIYRQDDHLGAGTGVERNPGAGKIRMGAAAHSAGGRSGRHAVCVRPHFSGKTVGEVCPRSKYGASVTGGRSSLV